MKIFIDGEFYSKDEAKVSVFDHGLLYGDGIFEGIRIYNGKAFLLEEHIRRLYRSAKSIMLEVPYSMQEMTEIIKKSLAENGRSDSDKTGYIRVIVTRGKGDLGLDPAKCLRATVIVIVDDISLYPAEYYEEGISIITSSTRRNNSSNVDPQIKSLNYLNNILARIEARGRGALEALMLNQAGLVTECTGDNIFIIKDDALVTPPLADGTLGGATRGIIKELAEDSLDVKTLEKSLTLYDVYNADECFLTGTAAEVMPVVKLDGRTIGNGRPGKVTASILEVYRNFYASYDYVTTDLYGK